MRPTARAVRTQKQSVGLAAALLALGCPAPAATAEERPEGASSRPSVASAPAPLSRGSGYERPGGAQAVRALQRRLEELGYRPGAVDGLFGPLTEAAVLRFQRAAGLDPDGAVGPVTRAALRSASRAQPPLRRGAGYGVPRGSERVRALQRRLRAAGHAPGPIDGRFGPLTEAAVLRFQAARELAVDGIAGHETERALARASARRAEEGRAPTGRAPTQRRPAREPSERDRRASARGREPGAPEPGPLHEAGGQSAEREAPEGGVSLALVLTAVAALGGLVLLLERALRHLRRAPRRPAGGQDFVFAGRGEGEPPWATYRGGPEAAAGRAAAPEGPGGAGHAEAGAEVMGYVSVADVAGLEGPEFEAQAEAIRRLCAERGWRLVELVRDVEGAAKGLERPGLAYALERVATGAVAGLAVAELRRLTRSVSELGELLEWFTERSARLVAVDLEVDTATPAGRLAARALVSVGGWERERLAERTRKGLAAARAKGSQISRPAVVDKPALRERIRAMREQGMTLQAIADRLNDEGVPTLRGGAMWRPSSVQAAAGYRRRPRERKLELLPLPDEARGPGGEGPRRGGEKGQGGGSARAGPR